MESLYNGRAFIDESLSFTEITIPTRKIWFLIALILIWLIPAVFGGLFAIIASISSSDTPFFFSISILFFWGFIVTFVSSRVFWMAFGKEIIQIDQGILNIRRKGLLFSKPKTYDLAECKSFRTVDNSIGMPFPFVLWTIFFNQNTTGAIAFDYGMRTIKCAEAIDEAEGKYILKLLKEKNLLTERNF